MTLSKKCCPQRLSSSWCSYIKFLSSHVESSSSKLFHLMRYSEIDRFRSCQVLVSVTAPGSNMIFPSSSSFGNIVWIGIFYNFWMSGHISSSFFHSYLVSFIQFGWIIEMVHNNASTSSSFLESAYATTFCFHFCRWFQSHNPTSLWPIFVALKRINFVLKSI